MSFLSEIIRAYQAGRTALTGTRPASAPGSGFWAEMRDSFERGRTGQPPSRSDDSFRRDPTPEPPRQEKPARDIARERAEYEARLAKLLERDARNRRESVQEAYKVIGRALGLD